MTTSTIPALATEVIPRTSIKANTFFIITKPPSNISLPFVSLLYLSSR
jgi:hypothetical protein